MKKFKFFAALAVLLSFVSSGASLDIGLGSGPMRVGSALTIPRGQLYLGAHSRAFFKDEISTTAGGSSSGVTFWDIQGALGLHYGFTSRLELGLSQILYQDNHKGNKGYNFPDDLYLRAKLGSIGPKTSNIRLGAQVDVRLPTAAHHNLALEPYSAGRIGMGIMGLFSIVSQPLFPDFGLNINLNAGVFTHNDLGIQLSEVTDDTLLVRKDTQEFVYGLSFSKGGQEFGFFAELYGRRFLQQPPVSAFTRENSLYFSPGISYSTNSWLQLKVALDLRILGSKDETSYEGEGGSLIARPWQTVPNLPTWRINVGAVVALHSKKHIQPTPRTTEQGQLITSAPASADEKLYKSLADSRQETENAEAELERIRSERQRMEDLLQRLRRILERPTSGSIQPQESTAEKPKQP